MDDQRKEHIDREGPNQSNRPKQQQTHNLPTDDMENINSKREEIYYSLISRRLFPEEQKRCWKGSRGTGVTFFNRSAHPKLEQDQTKNLAMAWIEYKRSYDMVLQSSIINCLKM